MPLTIICELYRWTSSDNVTLTQFWVLTGGTNADQWRGNLIHCGDNSPSMVNMLDDVLVESLLYKMSNSKWRGHSSFQCCATPRTWKGTGHFASSLYKCYGRWLRFGRKTPPSSRVQGTNSATKPWPRRACAAVVGSSCMHRHTPLFDCKETGVVLAAQNTAHGPHTAGGGGLAWQTRIWRHLCGVKTADGRHLSEVKMCTRWKQLPAIANFGERSRKQCTKHLRFVCMCFDYHDS